MGRFYKEEEKNVPEFAEKLAANADLFVNDAFGTAHRAHGSTEGVTKYLDTSVAGFLLQKELDYLDGAVAEPKRPFCAIVGGSKVSSKIGVIESLMTKVDKIVIGGGMVFTFLKARGLETGSSLVEEDQLELAKKLEKIAAEKGITFILPSDVIVADKFAADAATQTVGVDAIPEGWMGLDNGPESTKLIQDALGDCKTVIWNGPMGVFEFEAFAKGTFAIADTLANITGKGCITIIGGGDSVARWRRLASPRRCRTSRPAAAPRSSSSRARSCPALPRSRRRKRFLSDSRMLMDRMVSSRVYVLALV